MLWLWGIDNTDDTGEIIEADYDDIAHACDYHGDSHVIITALITAGFIEENKENGKIFIHDFEDYIGRLKEQKKRHREAQNRYRKGLSTKKSDNHSDSHNDNNVMCSHSPSHSPIYIDTDNKRNARANDDSKLTFAGNVYLSLDEHTSICQKFDPKYAAIRANHYITKLSLMKSDGYQSENDFTEILKLIKEGQ